MLFNPYVAIKTT